MPRKKKVEDVQVEEATVVDGQQVEKKELTEEEKKQMDAFLDAMVERKLRPRIQEVLKYMYDTKKSLDEVYHDLTLKKCGLSKLNRSFLTSFERSYIEQLIKNYLKKLRGE